MTFSSFFLRLQSARNWPLHSQTASGFIVFQTRTKSRITLPPYQEQNLVEKNMKRIPGLNDCPSNCLCSQKIEVSYKNTRLLTQFTSHQTGCILPRTITKVCMRKQRLIAKEIKRAHTMGFLPYTESLTQYHKDPRLFNRSRAQTEMYLKMKQDREMTRTQKFQPYYFSTAGDS